MDIPAMIVTALTLGATAGFKEVAEQSVKDAYNALTGLIKNKYNERVSLEVLEKSPDSATRQALIREDIINCGADKDREILLAVTSLLDQLSRTQKQPSPLPGVNIADVQAFNILIKNVISEGSGVTIQRTKAKGDIQIEDVVSGNKKKLTSDKTNNLTDVIAQNIEIGDKHYYGTGITEKFSATLKYVKSLLGHTYHINALSLQNNFLASGSGDQKAIIWDLSSGEKIFVAEHNSWVGSVIITGNHLITTTGKGEIIVWEYNQKKATAAITAHSGAIRTIALMKDQKSLFSGGKDTKVKRWSFPDLHLIDEFEYHPGEVRRLVTDNQGTLIFSGDSKGNVFLFDIKSQVNKQILNLQGQMIRSLAFSEKRKLLAITTSSGEVIVWDKESEMVKWRVQGHNGQSIGIAVHPDKEIVATGGQDKTIRIWNLENGALIDSIVGHSNTITSVVFSESGKWLVSSSRDETISVWQFLF